MYLNQIDFLHKVSSLQVFIIVEKKKQNLHIFWVAYRLSCISVAQTWYDHGFYIHFLNNSNRVTGKNEGGIL